MYMQSYLLVCILTITSLRLISSISQMVIKQDMDDAWYDFWVAYECLLLAFVLCTSLIMINRWRLMTMVNNRYADAKHTSDISSLSEVNHMYNHINSLVSVILTMTVFRTGRLVTLFARWSRLNWTMRKSGRTIVAVIACALITTSGAWRVVFFLGMFVPWRNKFDDGLRRYPVATVVPVAVYFFTFAAIVAIIVKGYTVWKVCLRRPPIQRKINII